MIPVASSPSASPPGDRLCGAVLDGRYRVGSFIARGGMSTVYRGVDERLDRPVALKVMDGRFVGDDQFLARFRLEARTVARLSDPGLVAVYDQGIDAGHPFLVMELVEGGTLRALLNERGPMPPHALAAVLRPTLSALAAAHRAGVVHRDIKPENILVSAAGEVKVVDFGLVRAVAESGLTSTNVILGTAAYLSPEQVRDGEVSPASDVYAVGVLAYELMTGRTPFAGDSALAVAHRRLQQAVPLPSRAIRGIPPHFDELITHATAADPARRYPDAAAMGVALVRIVDELHLPPFRVPVPRRPVAACRNPPPGSRSRAPIPTLQLTRIPTIDGRRDPGIESGVGDADVASFAGIRLEEFAAARLHARRMARVWSATLFAVTGAVATAAWTLGNNLGALF